MTKSELQKALQPLVTREDLANALEAQSRRRDEKLEALSLRVDERIENLSLRVDEKLEASISRVDQKIEVLSSQVGENVSSLTARTDGQIQSLHKKNLLLDRKLESELSSVARQTDLAALQSTMTVRLGSMMAAGIAILALIVGLF